ncbi:GNS1/SUR4 family protein [Cardiosporidium cionae]|uniref:Elongation of fatty acids protein n=1 Tax=Cardiosporidium cionae TaxID=476202 RepID=A0ABQ7J722_9APIC|nr:GNS1/SUR4 family protein [Cardiosporidium cionae]|eukprot:KAF8819490.1 GNS1/SUR4 family protein [Cardiosporidium cionae]
MEKVSILLMNGWDFLLLLLMTSYEQLYSFFSIFFSLFTLKFWTVPHRGAMLANDWKGTIIFLCILYPPAVLLGQRFMRNRAPLKLKYPAFLWNFLLASFSMFGVFLILRYDAPILLKRFFMEENYSPTTRAVITLFTLSKAIEFGDTAILVAKKKPILFLHVYHHFTVTLYCLHAQAVNVAFGHHFAFINLCIHSVMYLYYALTVIVPWWPILRVFRPYITISQTLQMVIGCGLAYSAICSSDLPASHGLNARLAFAMYISYAILFGKLYMENYRKQYRPFLTLFVGVIHLLALVGAWIVWQHAHLVRLLIEVLGGYCVTALLFWFTKDTIPFTTEQKVQSLLQEQAATSSSKTGSTRSPTLHGSSSKGEGLMTEKKEWKTKLQAVSQFAFLILNCIAAWLKDHMVVKIKNELKGDAPADTPTTTETISFPYSSTDQTGQNEMEALSPLSVKSGATNTPLDISCTSMASNSTQTSPCHRTASFSTMCSPGMSASLDSDVQKRKKGRISCLREFLKKVDDSIKPEKTAASLVSSFRKSSAIPQNLSPRNTKDTWMMVACLVTPAIYGMNIYGDFFLGLCVHGALRWVLELHTTNSFLKDIYSVAATAIKEA